MSASCVTALEEIKNSHNIRALAIKPGAKGHIEECQSCWGEYQELRWSLADGTKDVNELREFLGSDFVRGLDSSWMLAGKWRAEAPKTPDEVDRFYATADMYLYNLTLWHASGQRPRYVDMPQWALARFDVKSVVEVGAGVGTDALAFAESGLTVTAVEYDTLASKFMRWRFGRRGLELTWLEPGAHLPEPEYDVLWCMDVVEHLVDPMAVLRPYLKKCRLFIFATETDSNSNGRHPFHFQHDYREIEHELDELGFTAVYDPCQTGSMRVLAKNDKPHE